MTTQYNAGALRTKVRIQFKKTTGQGVNKTTEWLDIGNTKGSDNPRYTYCAWYPLAGTETWAANSVQAVDVANVVIRYNRTVTSQCRLLKDEVVYEIIAPNDPDQRKHWLKFKVKAAVNG